jgi:opacity protein-like surface antigen
MARRTPTAQESPDLADATAAIGVHCAVYTARTVACSGAVMKRLFAAVALASLASLATVRAADRDAAADATAAARAWLSVVDAGNYGQSWDEAAEPFKHNITKSQWERAVGSVREQTGAMKTRTLESAEPTHHLPGVPDGDYVVIVYHSSFAKAATATETVTPMRDADGQWRVAAYRVK